jgi:hypothetical protein
MKSEVYIVLKDWIDYNVCNKHRIVSQFSIPNTSLEIELKNCKKLAPKKIDIDRAQNKLTLFI